MMIIYSIITVGDNEVKAWAVKRVSNYFILETRSGSDGMWGDWGVLGKLKCVRFDSSAGEI